MCCADRAQRGVEERWRGVMSERVMLGMVGLTQESPVRLIAVRLTNCPRGRPQTGRLRGCKDEVYWLGGDEGYSVRESASFGTARDVGACERAPEAELPQFA